MVTNLRKPLLSPKKFATVGRMETMELQAHISLVARLLGGVKDITPENIDRLIGMREQYGVTGKHPGYKKYL